MLGLGPTADAIKDALASLEATCTDADGHRWYKMNGTWSSTIHHDDGSVTFRESERHPLALGHEAVQGEHH